MVPKFLSECGQPKRLVQLNASSHFAHAVALDHRGTSLRNSSHPDTRINVRK